MSDRRTISPLRFRKIQSAFRSFYQQIFVPVQKKDMPKDKGKFLLLLTEREKSVTCRLCHRKEWLSPGFEMAVNHNEIVIFKKKHEKCHS